MTTINESRSREIAWRRLAQFQDIERSTDRLLNQRPEIPRGQRDNVRKQIQQMSFSLTQAKEFFKSAEASGPTTRALQTYYGLTALANVVILWEGTGNDCFERRNGRFNAHGLELKLGNDVLAFGAEPKRQWDASLSGLFGLWHTYATHIPQYAECIEYHGGESTVSRYRPVSSVTSLCEITFPSASQINLLDGLSHIPALQQSLSAYGIKPRLARGRVDISDSFGVNRERIEGKRTFTIHPCAEDIRMSVMERFLFLPRSFEDISIIQPPNGIIIKLDTTRDHSANSSSPEAFAGTKDQMYFVGSGDYLNEFGYYYVCLYIAGMITRYHPTHWIKELATNSVSTALVDELVDSALTRLPLLVLSLLERSIFLYD
ncbi:YaaC family protein [Neorhizobium galegae]|uniref:YaaC family protein n=1 Tax=Neorhizobium galegae TaxID=399 RepID=UPI003F96694B